ncbi:MAG: TolC family protein, partial [Verrucomicrobiota bacterium]
MRRCLLILTALTLAGCAHFESKPIEPEKSAAQLESRRLDDPGLKQFLEQNLGRELPGWPLESWDLPTLTLAAFYYQPSLAVARAQWHVAQAGVKTAGGRPNPTLAITPEYNSTTTIPTPWAPSVSFDMPIETAGKRGKRIAEASHLSESARWDIITAAWKVRSDVRTSLLDFTMSEQRAELLKKQFTAQQQISKLLRQRLDAGEISLPEFTTAQLAFHKTQLDYAEAKSKLAEARSRLAEAIGFSATALVDI